MYKISILTVCLYLLSATSCKKEKKLCCLPYRCQIGAVNDSFINLGFARNEFMSYDEEYRLAIVRQDRYRKTYRYADSSISIVTLDTTTGVSGHVDSITYSSKRLAKDKYTFLIPDIYNVVLHTVFLYNTDDQLITTIETNLRSMTADTFAYEWTNGNVTRQMHRGDTLSYDYDPVKPSRDGDRFILGQYAMYGRVIMHNKNLRIATWYNNAKTAADRYEYSYDGSDITSIRTERWTPDTSYIYDVVRYTYNCTK